MSAAPLPLGLALGPESFRPGTSCPAPPRPAEVPFKDQRDHYYQLPIARGDICFLASWEDLAQHEAQLLRVGPWALLGLKKACCEGAGYLCAAEEVAMAPPHLVGAPGPVGAVIWAYVFGLRCQN